MTTRLPFTQYLVPARRQPRALATPVPCLFPELTLWLPRYLYGE